MVTVTKTGNWRLYWGMMPLPEGAEAFGLVKRETPGDSGALIKLASGVYVQGNAGSIRTLPQRDVLDALAVSDAAATLGRHTSPRKAASSAANGRTSKTGGRPRKVQPTG